MSQAGQSDRRARRPWGHWLVLAALLAAYIAQSVRPRLREQWLLNSRDLRLANFISYGFIHTNWIHLAGNLLALALFGRGVQERLGRGGYIAFFLAAIIFCGVVFALSQGAGAGARAVVGASGAAGAVMGAAVVLRPRGRIVIPLGRSRRALRMSSLYLVAIYFSFNLAMALLSGPGPVAYEVHLAGLLFGAVVALGLRVSKLVGPDGDGPAASAARPPGATAHR